jgi:O-antigen/teichoic acid export membrane protein
MIQSIYAWLRARIDHFLENALFRRIIKNSGYLFSTTGISAALGMLQGILAARLLGVVDFGILGTIIMFTSVVNKFASFRMSELVIKYVGHYTENDEPQQAAAVFKSAALVEMCASFFAFGLVWLLAPIGAKYFVKDIHTTNLFIIYGLIVLANLIAESSTGLLQIYDRFRRIAVLNLVQSTATLSLITLAYFLQGGLLGVLLAYVVGKTIGALGLTIAALIEATKQWGPRWWRAPINTLRQQARELTHFAVSTNISATINLVTKDSELLWVSFFRTPAEAGYYKLALSLVNIVQLPISPLPQATYPEFSRQVTHKNWGNIRYIMRRGSLLAGGYTLIAALFLLLFGRPLISLIYSPEFLPAYPALLLLLAGFLFANTFYWRRPALLSLGAPDFPAKLNFILAALKIVGILLLVPIYGYLASAALLAGFYILGSLISAAKIRSLISQRELAG